MTEKVYPSEFAMLAKDPNVVKTMVGDHEPIGPSDCHNCGGIGLMSIVLLEKGPYVSPGPSYGKYSSYYNEEDKSYWLGECQTRPCPVCQGSGRKDKFHPTVTKFGTVKAIQEKFPSQRSTTRVNKETGEIEYLEIDSFL